MGLSWLGPFLDGPLRRRVKGRESTWCISGDDDSGRFLVLHIMMPKDDPHYWRGLFEGGEERSHIEVCPWIAIKMLSNQRSSHHSSLV